MKAPEWRDLQAATTRVQPLEHPLRMGVEVDSSYPTYFLSENYAIIVAAAEQIGFSSLF